MTIIGASNILAFFTPSIFKISFQYPQGRSKLWTICGVNIVFFILLIAILSERDHITIPLALKNTTWLNNTPNIHKHAAGMFKLSKLNTYLMGSSRNSKKARNCTYLWGNLNTFYLFSLCESTTVFRYWDFYLKKEKFWMIWNHWTYKNTIYSRSMLLVDLTFSNFDCTIWKTKRNSKSY